MVAQIQGHKPSAIAEKHYRRRPLDLLRIEAWLGLERRGEARLWLAEQTAYDMWQAEQKIKAAPLHVQRAPALHDLMRPRISRKCLQGAYMNPENKTPTPEDWRKCLNHWCRLEESNP